jgi:hypothetical protein
MNHQKVRMDKQKHEVVLLFHCENSTSLMVEPEAEVYKRSHV